jgi:multidrug efflux system membrane fusion protein
MTFRTVLASLGGVAVAAFIVLPLVTGRSVETLATDATSVVRGLTENTARPPGAAPSAPLGTPQAPPASVTTSQPLRRAIVEWDETTGRFDAVETVDLRARVNGYLQEVRFKDGQDVAKGDVLFIIDPRPYERALAQSRAELEQAKTRIGNASLDVERARPLLERKVLSEKVFDDRENLQREAESQARVAEEKVKSAELDLSFTTITAPVAGRIGRALVTPGNYVSAAGSSGVTTLATIVSQDPIYIYFDITEADALKYKRLADKGAGVSSKSGARVEIGLPDEKGYPSTGPVDFLDNRLDPGTGSLRARARLENPSRLFTPGQFARVRLQGSDTYTATLVPDEAVGSDQGNRYVVAVGTDDVPVRKPVKLGPLVDGLRVVREGLDADDWVVTKGLTRVRPGQKVNPKRESLKVSEGALGAGVVRY